MKIRPMLSTEVLAEFKRLRLTDAMAELCIEQGYQATSIADVVARARTSRNTAYDHFGNREEIFLALLDRAIPRLFSRIEEACEAAAPEERIEAGLRALLSWVAEEPGNAWAFFIESLCATPESFRRYEAAVTRLTTMLAAAIPAAAPRSESATEILVGGVITVLRFRLLRGEAESAPELLPELIGFFGLPLETADKL
jgi:AcrR family transcriptional regulator